MPIIGFLCGIFVAVLHQAVCSDSCNYTYADINGLKCFPCKPGYTAVNDCPRNLTSVKCVQCQDGTYQPHCATFNGSTGCRICTVCDVYKEKCTIFNDAVCEPIKDAKFDCDASKSYPETYKIWLIFGTTLLLTFVLFTLHCRLERFTRKTESTKSRTPAEKCLKENAKDQRYPLITENATFKTVAHKKSEHEANADVKETIFKHNENDEKHIAVVSPFVDQVCIDVGHISERLQATGENIQTEEDTITGEVPAQEIKGQDNQLCHGTNDHSITLKALGTPESQVDWTKVFLQLAKKFPPTSWQIFAIHLLSNCFTLTRNPHDTVQEIELEARNQHTEGFVIYAYLKVFQKWLNNLGSKSPTFKQILDAVHEVTESREILELVNFIERNPPLKKAHPAFDALVPTKYDQAFGSRPSHLHQYMALHDDEVPSSSNSVRELYLRTSIQKAHCPHCSLYSSNKVSSRRETSIQLNKTSFEGDSNINDKNTVKRESIKRRKKTQLNTQQNKRSATENYIIENARQNLLDFMPIRQNDYDLYMNFVINRLTNECQVRKKTVLSVTLTGFCEAHEIKKKDKESLFVIKGMSTNLCLRKEVYEDLAIYGNVARPKLLAYLKANNTCYGNIAEEMLLFIEFNGEPLLEQMKNGNVENVENIAVKGKEGNEKHPHVDCHSIDTCPDMKESEQNLKGNLTQNSPNQAFELEQNEKCNDNNNTMHVVEFKPYEGEERGTLNKADSEQETQDKRKENKDQENSSANIDIEKELETIKTSLFPTGDEIYNLPNADDVAEMLNNFVEQDLKPSSESK